MSFDFIADHSNRRAELALSNSQRNTVRGIRQAFYFIGRDMRSTANKNILERPRSGRVYKIKGRRHVASSPGESFANFTGAARRTLGFQVRGGDNMEFGFRKNSRTIYTKILEEEKNRPTLEIAVKSNSRNAIKHFRKEIKRALKEGF